MNFTSCFLSFAIVFFGCWSLSKNSIRNNSLENANANAKFKDLKKNKANNLNSLPSTSANLNVAPKSPNILDFDADVIEGERSGPSLIVQMDLQAPSLDTLVFQRKNFNDFQVIDKRRKPKFRGQ